MLSPFTHDTVNQVFYDSRKGRYVAYLRAMTGHGRAVAYYEPPDPFAPWPIRPSPRNPGVASASPYDPPGHLPPRAYYVGEEMPIALEWSGALQVYNPCVHPYRDGYLAFPDVFRVFPGPHHPHAARFPGAEVYAWPNDGLVAPRLYLSGDGVHFTPVDEKPYIDLGCQDEPDCAQVRMVAGLVERDGEVWQYYGAQRTGHTLARGRRPRRGSCVVRVVQRRDGFAALVAGASPGEAVTAVTACTGPELRVNYDAGAWGEVRVEVLDEEGRKMPGFGPGDAAPLVGNRLGEPVLWSEGRSLASLVGRRLRLRFRLSRARLYAFGFAAGP
ncbi:MAG: hypothetical protein AB1505_00800 [Candidatus Latescibacterota bacterium]